jgi:hypothetical protein
MDEPACQCADTAFVGHCGDLGRWDGFVHKARRKVAVVPHPKPSREQVAEDLESQVLGKPGTSSAPLSRAGPLPGRSARRCC